MPKWVVRLLKTFSTLLSSGDEISSNMILQMRMRNVPWLFPTCKYSTRSSIFFCQHHWPVLLFLQSVENRSRFSSYHYSWTTQGTTMLNFIFVYLNNSLIWRENRLGYLSADIFCSEKWTVFWVQWQRIVSKGKYPSIFFKASGGYSVYYL